MITTGVISTYPPSDLFGQIYTLCKIVLSKPKPYIFYSNLNLCPSEYYNLETVDLSVKHDEEDQSGGATRDKKGWTWTSRVGLANRLPQKDKW